VGDIEPQYVCVYVPEFPAQARLRLRPEQAKLAVVILDGEPPLQTVYSATKKARREGIADGMTRAELDAFPGVSLLPRSKAEESATQSALFSASAVFTPRVEARPSENAFSFVLDMAGTHRMFGDSTHSARLIAEAMRSVGVSAKLAVSCNLLAAACAAPYARTPWVIPAGAEADTLGPLPVSALGLSQEQTERLELWGIRTLKEFASLPDTDLVVRMGRDAKRLRDTALGTAPHLMVPKEPQFKLEEYIEFDCIEERLEALLFVLGPIIDRLICRAQIYALALAEIVITLLLDGGGEHIRTLKPALPSADRKTLLKLINLDLQSHPPSKGVIALRVFADAGKRGKVQIGLFSPQFPEASRLDVTLAQIEAMVGDGRVGSPRLLDSHRPESFTVERFAVPSKTPNIEKLRMSASLRRVRPPVALSIGLDPMGKPRFFHFEGKRFSVAEAYGPWRQSGEWWSQRVWSQEDWDVRATAGPDVMLCVIAHDLLRREWRLEALYD